MYFKMAGHFLKLKKNIVPHINILENNTSKDVSQFTDTDRRKKQAFLEELERNSNSNKSVEKIYTPPVDSSFIHSLTVVNLMIEIETEPAEAGKTYYIQDHVIPGPIENYRIELLGDDLTQTQSTEEDIIKTENEEATQTKSIPHYQSPETELVPQIEEPFNFFELKPEPNNNFTVESKSVGVCKIETVYIEES